MERAGSFVELNGISLFQEPAKNCWIAEVYEPPLFELYKNGSLDYSLVHEESMDSTELELKSMRKTIVGTISIELHRSLPNAGWISHFAVDPKHKFEQIAEALITRALKFAADIKMSSMETATTECQCDLRELLLKMNFSLKQVYTRQIMGSSSFRIMKSQMGIDLLETADSKNK